MFKRASQVASWAGILAASGVVSGVRPAQAGSGADLLLRGVQGKSGAVTTESNANSASNDALSSLKDFQLNDPFAIQLYSSWQAVRGQLPPELNHWVNLVLKNEREQAAHLWGSIEKQLPSSFSNEARLAHLATLAHLGLSQTAVDGWVDYLTTASGAWTQPAKPAAITAAFESSWPQILGGTLDQVMAERGILLSPEQERSIFALDAKSLPSIATIQAQASLRKGEQGRALLDLLPPKHAFKLPLAQTVALTLARKGDLASAAMTLKTHAEAALESQGNLTKVSAHLLQIARFLFQAGMWEEAEAYLRKIPNTAPEFLNAREELAWILLRKGDVQNLRGEVASLSSPGTAAQFQPELPVVRAISNLKLCSFGAVQKDFNDFQTTYGAWAKRIESALAATPVPAPESRDAFTQAAERRVSALNEEASRLAGLFSRSIQSGLPSVVGQQSHWKKTEEKIAGRVEWSKKIVQAEYRRQWKNQKMMMGEAIRKLRFVKIELLHQMNVLAQAESKSQDRISLSQAAPISSEGQVVFPLDGVLWPDEFFRIQGVVEQRCLKGISR